MNVRKLAAAIFCLILAVAVFMPSAHAGEYDQMTKLTFNQPVEIPGVVLPAGAYWFVLASNNSDRDIVQIFSSDWSQLYATLMTVPTERMQSRARTEIVFAERPHQAPQALLKWYYPGLSTGHRFLYLKKEERELARDAKLEVIGHPASLASNSSTPRG